MEEQVILQVINKAESGSRKLVITFGPTATVDDVKFLCGIERAGIFEIDSKTARKFTRIMNSGKWNQNRTFPIGLGPSFDRKWLLESRLTDVIERLEVIS